MTLALSTCCLADRHGGCRAGVRRAWCVRRTPSRGELLSSRAAFHTAKPARGTAATAHQLSVWASPCLPPPLFPPGSSEPHLPVEQDQHLAISNQKFWKEGESSQKSGLELLLSLSHPYHLFDWGRADSPAARSLVGKLLAVCTTAKEWAHRFPAIAVRWGFRTPELSVVSKKKGILAGAPEPPLSILASVNFSKGFKGGLHLLFPLGFVTLPALQVSGCQHLSPGWLGLCYFVLKLVCFFNGYK